MPFGEDTLVFRVGEKLFLLTSFVCCLYCPLQQVGFWTIMLYIVRYSTHAQD
jgi:hypothetical protein